MLTQTEKIREDAYRCFNSGRFRESIELSVSALVSDPWTPWCYYLTGMSLASLGGKDRADKAIVYLRRYVELEPSRFSSARQKAQSMIASIERSVSGS